ncbi:hypothetical protein, partial [Succinimonas amylolytica]|uniref:hypothetical protein n=1 Tax=Succinimonas amylolytica TaxID=83769 RepID=UPI0023A7FE4D
MTDLNYDLFKEFHENLQKEMKDLENFSDATSVVAIECSVFKSAVMQHIENLTQQRTEILDEVNSLKTNGFMESLVKSWRKFDKDVRINANNFREKISPGISAYEMASVFDKATDNDIYERSAKDFNYRDYIKSTHKVSGKNDNHEDSTGKRDTTTLFTSDPYIEKIIKEQEGNLYKRDLLKPTIKFLKKECKTLIERTATDIDNDKRGLLARLFFKLARNSELRPLIWNEEYLKVLFGIDVKEVLNTFSYPQISDKHIKNFQDAVEILNSLFLNTFVSDFDFKKIRTELLKELLINAFHCYINPLYFDKTGILNISRELEEYFDISWDELMKEETEYMKMVCPGKILSDIFFLGQMSRTDFCKSPEQIDENLINKIDKVASNSFRLIGCPLVFDLYSTEYFNLMELYGFNFSIIKQDDNLLLNVRKIIEFFSKNVKQLFKRYVLLSFIDLANNYYINQNKQVFSENEIHDSEFEAMNNEVENLRLKIIKTFPKDVEFYLQPRCREVLENMVGVEYLG